MDKHVSLVAPKPDERAWAATVHVASVFWPILAPLIALALFRKQGGFVAHHAKKALTEALLVKIVLFLLLCLSIALTARLVIGHAPTGFRDFPWQQTLARFALSWAALAAFGLLNTVVSLRQAFKAWQGRLK